MSKTLCDPTDCSMPGFPVHHQLLELAQTHVHCVSNAIQPSHPLSSPLLQPSIFPSIRIFSNESALRIRWPKYWSFSFSSSPSNEYSGLISFRIDWLDLLAVQGTLKSLPQHHSSEASILRPPVFFMVQLSKMHNKCNVLEAPHPGPWKNCLPQNRSPVPKRLGSTAPRLCLRPFPVVSCFTPSAHCSVPFPSPSTALVLSTFILLHMGTESIWTSHCSDC